MSATVLYNIHTKLIFSETWRSCLKKDIFVLRYLQFDPVTKHWTCMISCLTTVLKIAKRKQLDGDQLTIKLFALLKCLASLKHENLLSTFAPADPYDNYALINIPDFKKFI